LVFGCFLDSSISWIHNVDNDGDDDDDDGAVMVMMMVMISTSIIILLFKIPEDTQWFCAFLRCLKEKERYQQNWFPIWRDIMKIFYLKTNAIIV
jgi:hypothetical protein